MQKFALMFVTMFIAGLSFAAASTGNSRSHDEAREMHKARKDAERWQKKVDDGFLKKKEKTALRAQRKECRRGLKEDLHAVNNDKDLTKEQRKAIKARLRNRFDDDMTAFDEEAQAMKERNRDKLLTIPANFYSR